MIIKVKKYEEIIPIGKNVNVLFDQFFNKYLIGFKDKYINLIKMEFNFLENNEGGSLYKGYDDNSYFFIHDNMESNNKILLVPAKTSNINGKESKITYMIDYLKLKK